MHEHDKLIERNVAAFKEACLAPFLLLCKLTCFKKFQRSMQRGSARGGLREAAIVVNIFNELSREIVGAPQKWWEISGPPRTPRMGIEVGRSEVVRMRRFRTYLTVSTEAEGCSCMLTSKSTAPFPLFLVGRAVPF